MYEKSLTVRVVVVICVLMVLGLNLGYSVSCNDGDRYPSSVVRPFGNDGDRYPSSVVLLKA